MFDFPMLGNPPHMIRRFYVLKNMQSLRTLVHQNITGITDYYMVILEKGESLNHYQWYHEKKVAPWIQTYKGRISCSKNFWRQHDWSYTAVKKKWTTKISVKPSDARERPCFPLTGFRKTVAYLTTWFMTCILQNSETRNFYYFITHCIPLCFLWQL